MNRHTRVIREIIEMHPDAMCELHFSNAFELLIATMLSAQTTDKQVNLVTPLLFDAFPDARSLAASTPDLVAPYIQRIGLYNAKAKNIVATAQMLVAQYDGIVPKSMEQLTALPGVGRKTANVVLSNAFAVPSFAVDTHVKRVTYRLGLTKNSDPDKVERDITSKIPKYLYIQAHHAIIFHGRRICKAQQPNCGLCSLTKDCPHYKKQKGNHHG